MTDWTSISTAISSATEHSFHIRECTAANGGCVNRSYRICGHDGRQFFVKLNEARHLPMFNAETLGLDTLAATQTLRTPQWIISGSTETESYLVLEYLELHSHGDAARLGEQLAALHRCSGERFGYLQDNFIGTTPQPNGWESRWVDFWRERRLGFQLRLAAQNGFAGRLQAQGEKLLNMLPIFFADHEPHPSLLHGDLWGGNHAFLADGTPLIFDPAPYYGDRECDLAMTELFGGYPDDFHAAYRAAYPLDAGYAVRRNLYNLYHILNHANLFGGSYVRQAEQIIRRLLAEAGHS